MPGETLGPVFEREKPASGDASLEQARMIGISAVVQRAGEINRAAGDAGSTERQALTGNERTAVWLNVFSNSPEGVYDQSEHQDLRGRNEQGQENGKDMYLAFSASGDAVTATDKDTDLGNTVKKVRLDKIVGRDGNNIGVVVHDEATDTSRTIQIPLSVFQESFLLTHKDALLADGSNESQNLGPAQKKIIEAYVAAKGDPAAVDFSTLRSEMKEAAAETPGIKANAASEYIKHTLADAEKMKDKVADPVALEAKMKELADLQTMLETQDLCTSEDMKKLMSIVTSPEVISVEVAQVEAEYNKVHAEVADLKEQLGSMGDVEGRGQLEALLKQKQAKLAELTIAKDFQTRIGQSEHIKAIDSFFEKAQNGGLDAGMLGEINSALEKGDMDGIFKQVVTQIDKDTSMDADKKEAAKKRLEKLKKDGLMIGGGLLLAILFMVMQSVKE